MRLLRTEFSRFFARRFLHATLVVILLVLGAVVAAVAANTSSVDPAEYAAAQRAALRDYEANKASIQETYQSCVADVTSPNPSGQWGTGGLEICASILEKAQGIEPSDPSYYLPPRFHLADDLEVWVYLAAVVLCLFGFAIGASFVGAEWTSGGMTNLALWYPRRIALLSTKLAAAVLSIGAIAVVYLGIWVGSLALVAQTRGIVDGATSGFWQSILLLCVRSLVLALVCAVIGFALASLGRHTAAALGIGAGYALIVEIGTLLIFGVLNNQFPDRFRLSTYVGAWMAKRIELYDYDLCVDGAMDCGSRFYVIDLSSAALVLGSLVAILLAAAMVSFRRRDIA